MLIKDLRDLLEATLLCGEERLYEEFDTVFASDMMSDVLACPDEIHCMLTGLMNAQVIRTADMMDIGIIVFVRGKVPLEETVQLAKDNGIPILLTKYSMFEACGILFAKGMKPSIQIQEM